MAHVFDEAEYADPPCTGLETQDPDGTWHAATAHTHAARGNVVLWYGGGTCEGLGGGYRWGAGVDAGSQAGNGSGPAPRLLDGDGDVVPTRWACRGVRAQPRGSAAGAPPVRPRHAAAGGQPAGAGHQPRPRPALVMPFGEVLAAARSLGLATQQEWHAWAKGTARPAAVPHNPQHVYRDGGWQGWGHWLGTEPAPTEAAQFLPFGEALAAARALRLANMREWTAWCKEGARPPNVPSHPNRTYKDGGWQGWGHWLGTGNTKNGKEQILPFDEAVAVVWSLGLASQKEWWLWCKEGRRPPNVPSHPDRVYKDGGWQGWGHWLGTSNQRNRPNVPFLPFDEALAVALSLNLASSKEWKAWCREGRRPPNIPSDPSTVYKDGGWQGWGHWLGTGNLPFKEALVFARSLKMHSRQAWQSWSAKGLRPVNVPACPCQVYKNSGWQGWGHWLGTGTAKRGPEQFLPFAEALAMARSLKLPGHKQWKLWSKSGARPGGMPSAPERTYRLDGWEGFGHWLGTGNRLHQVKAFLPFQEALVLARSLHLDSPASWSARSRKEFLRARNVPVDPSRSYVTCRTRAGLPLAALEAMGVTGLERLLFLVASNGARLVVHVRPRTDGLKL